MNNEEKILKILEGLTKDVSGLRKDVNTLKEDSAKMLVPKSRLEALEIDVSLMKLLIQSLSDRLAILEKAQ